MTPKSRQNEAMDAQVRQAEAMERIADALERLANKFAPAGSVRPRELQENANGGYLRTT